MAPPPLRLMIPIGDPAGIGPEVVLKALALGVPDLPPGCRCTVVGDRNLLARTPLGDQHLDLDGVEILDLPEASQGPIWPGQPTVAGAASGFRYLQAAIAECLAGRAEGVVTAPIAKALWHQAGFHYPGQTEALAEAAGVSQFGMLFVGRSPHTGWVLRMLLATTHIPLAQVPQALTPELLDRKLALLVHCLEQDFAIAQPRIAISGLNPHSGEQGQLGQEEVSWMQDWLDQARRRYSHCQLDGLIPPDTLWVKPGQAWFGHGKGLAAAAHDGYLALYHDQGLIPVKLMAFDVAVNTTIGLPFVRTSPDHGTAFDIAGQGIADATSMQAAIAWGAQLASVRRSLGAK